MKLVRNFITSLLILSQIACGTLLYPDRQGQSNSQRLDPAILVLNGIGLVFFVIPGLVAFVVDFSTRAIYLPNGSSASADQLKQLQKLQLSGDVSPESINQVIREHTGVGNVLDHENLDIQQIDPVHLSGLLNINSPLVISRVYSTNN